MKTEKQIAEMDRKAFRAYAQSLPPKQAEEARKVRHRIRVRAWQKKDVARARELGRSRWHNWRSNMTQKQEAEFRAKDAERKRRARAKQRARS
jgi:hypothetical protein